MKIGFLSYLRFKWHLWLAERYDDKARDLIKRLAKLQIRSKDVEKMYGEIQDNLDFAKKHLDKAKEFLVGKKVDV